MDARAIRGACAAAMVSYALIAGAQAGCGDERPDTAEGEPGGVTGQVPDGGADDGPAAPTGDPLTGALDAGDGGGGEPPEPATCPPGAAPECWPLPGPACCSEGIVALPDAVWEVPAPWGVAAAGGRLVAVVRPPADAETGPGLPAAQLWYLDGGEERLPLRSDLGQTYERRAQPVEVVGSDEGLALLWRESTVYDAEPWPVRLTTVAADGSVRATVEVVTVAGRIDPRPRVAWAAGELGVTWVTWAGAAHGRVLLGRWGPNGQLRAPPVEVGRLDGAASASGAGLEGPTLAGTAWQLVAAWGTWQTPRTTAWTVAIADVDGGPARTEALLLPADMALRGSVVAGPAVAATVVGRQALSCGEGSTHAPSSRLLAVAVGGEPVQVCEPAHPLQTVVTTAGAALAVLTVTREGDGFGLNVGRMTPDGARLGPDLRVAAIEGASTRLPFFAATADRWAVAWRAARGWRAAVGRFSE